MNKAQQEFKANAVESLIKAWKIGGANLGCYAEFECTMREHAMILAQEAMVRGVEPSRARFDRTAQTAYIYTRYAYDQLVKELTS